MNAQLLEGFLCIARDTITAMDKEFNKRLETKPRKTVIAEFAAYVSGIISNMLMGAAIDGYPMQDEVLDAAIGLLASAYLDAVEKGITIRKDDKGIYHLEEPEPPCKPENPVIFPN